MMTAVATQERNLAEIKQMIHAALRSVAGHDTDYARERNNVGFSKYDADFGHKLANQQFPLTDKQAPAAFRLAWKYRVQVERAGLQLPTYEELGRALASQAQGAAVEAQNRVQIEAARRAAGMQIKSGDPARGTVKLVKDGKVESIEVAFPYNPALVDQCRRIKTKFGGGYKGETRTWYFTKTALDDVLKTFDGFAIDWTLDRIKGEREALRAAEAARAKAKSNLTKRLNAAAEAALGKNLDQPLPGGRVMFQHQRDGVRRVFEIGKLIIADEMGLGKTTTALVAAKFYHEVLGARIIVLARPSLHDTAWRQDARTVDVQIEIYSNHMKKIPAVEVMDGLGKPFVLIADEAHDYQTVQAGRTKRFLELAASRHCVSAMLLTGTPIKNGRPTNLFPLLKAVDHELAQNRKEYERVFCAAGATRFSRWDASGASHLDLLHERTTDVLLRRKKKDCLDLPQKTRVMRKAELSAVAAERYDRKLRELVDSYMERLRLGIISSGGEVLVEMGQLRHAGSIGKSESAIEIAQEIIEEDRKVVIFTEFEASVSMIASQLEAFGAGVVRLTGETPRKDGHGVDGFTVVDCLCRGCIIWRFQNDPKTNVFIGTVKAGGVGVTLTAADTVILVDRPWTPGDAEQAEDRLHRIGQTSNVTAIWLQHGEIDERVDDILIQKQERIQLVLEGKRKTMRGIESAGDVAKEILSGLLGRDID
jgi:hypothetical protein